MTQIISKRMICLYTMLGLGLSSSRQASERANEDMMTMIVHSIRPGLVLHTRNILVIRAPIHYDFSFSLHRHPFISKMQHSFGTKTSARARVWVYLRGGQDAIVLTFDVLVILVPNIFIIKMKMSVVVRLHAAKSQMDVPRCYSVHTSVGRSVRMSYQFTATLTATCMSSSDSLQNIITSQSTLWCPLQYHRTHSSNGNYSNRTRHQIPWQSSTHSVAIIHPIIRCVLYSRVLVKRMKWTHRFLLSRTKANDYMPVFFALVHFAIAEAL